MVTLGQAKTKELQKDLAHLLVGFIVHISLQFLMLFGKAVEVVLKLSHFFPCDFIFGGGCHMYLVVVSC